jgi:hypothetical protein
MYKFIHLANTRVKETVPIGKINQWLRPVILAIQEAGQEDPKSARANNSKDPIWKVLNTKKCWGCCKLQTPAWPSRSPEFKPSYHQKNKAKRAGDLVQVILCLPSKCEA